MKLLVVGSSNMDLVIFVPRIPQIGETIIGGTSDMIFGGKGANQAIAAIRAGGEVGFISKLGADAYGNKMKAHYKKEGLPSDLILTDEQNPTGVAQIWVSDKGENSIVVASGANMNLNPEDIDRFKSLFEEVEIVLLQLEIPLETIKAIVDIANQVNTKVILNPAPAQHLENDLLSKTWILTPNESETELLTSMKVTDLSSAEQAGKHLLDKGVKNVLITLGEEGSLLCNKEGFKHYPAFIEKAIDTTAAGDVFNGALAVSLTQGQTLDEAITFASAAAAISVTRKGAQPSAPARSEIMEYLSKYHQ